jgi:hypothetical protein
MGVVGFATTIRVGTIPDAEEHSGRDQRQVCQQDDTHEDAG